MQVIPGCLVDLHNESTGSERIMPGDEAQRVDILVSG